jgi:hypothetical protein
MESRTLPVCFLRFLMNHRFFGLPRVMIYDNNDNDKPGKPKGSF